MNFNLQNYSKNDLYVKNIMIKNKQKISLLFPKTIVSFFLSIFLIFCTSIRESYAQTHEWIGVPKSKYGEQLWDKKSIKRNQDGSVRVLSKFIPKTKSEITEDILYTMDINCFEKSFRDVDVSSYQTNSLADWRDPNEDQLILGVIGQVCDFEK